MFTRVTSGSLASHMLGRSVKESSLAEHFGFYIEFNSEDLSVPVKKVASLSISCKFSYSKVGVPKNSVSLLSFKLGQLYAGLYVFSNKSKLASRSL